MDGVLLPGVLSDVSIISDAVIHPVAATVCSSLAWKLKQAFPVCISVVH